MSSAERVRMWRKNNPDRAKELASESYKRNASKRRAYASKYFQEVKKPQPKTEDSRLGERIKKQNQRTHGRGVTREDWLDLCAKWDQKCAYCGEQKPLTMDHVIAVSKGGIHEISNIVPACKPCNTRKGNK